MHLADGRELIYFDESDAAVRDEPDKRDLPPPPPASEIRYDPVLDEWVAIAAHRQTRTHLPPSDECPLCPSTPERSTEIPAYDYDVAVFENRFPSFSHREAVLDPPHLAGLSDTRPGYGRCEVVCFTADHNASFASLTEARVRLVVEAWADRTAELAGLRGVEQVFCFENRGKEIGVTLTHPHGQIYAYPFLPARTQALVRQARSHRSTTGRSLLADVLAADQQLPGCVDDEPLWPLAPGIGRCEVVCFTSDPDASFATLSPLRVRTVIEAWADRTAELSAMPGVEQVFCFENRGKEIGVTLHHPHGQIYAFPFVAPKLAQMVTQAREYATGHDGANLFDDMVAAEVAAGTRVVTRNEHWVVFVPEAARWPYEVRIFPLVRVPDLPALDEAARDSFGPLYLDVLRRFDALFDKPAPYIAAWHQAPVGDADARGRFAAHLQVLSVRRAPNKLKYLAGTESGMGVWINDIVPEEAALRLREA